MGEYLVIRAELEGAAELLKVITDPRELYWETGGNHRHVLARWLPKKGFQIIPKLMDPHYAPGTVNDEADRLITRVKACYWGNLGGREDLIPIWKSKILELTQTRDELRRIIEEDVLDMNFEEEVASDIKKIRPGSHYDANEQSLEDSYVSSLNNVVYSVALLVGVFVGYSFSSFVFLREKRERVIESLLCTPLSLKSIWFGKVLGATLPAYLFSLLSVTLMLLVSNVGMHTTFLPSVAILIHILFVAPVFIASTISLMGFCQFMLGMRENRIIGFLIILVFLPFMYPSILGGLVLGNTNVDVSWIEVEICLSVSVLLLALTIYLSRYLGKEKIITTIPS